MKKSAYKSVKELTPEQLQKRNEKARAYYLVKKERKQKRSMETNARLQRALTLAQAIPVAAIHVCAEFLCEHCQSSENYNDTEGSYLLSKRIQQWHNGRSAQKILITEGSVLEACRLLEFPFITDVKNPQHADIAYELKTEPAAT